MNRRTRLLGLTALLAPALLAAQPAQPWGSFDFLDRRIAPGETTRLNFSPAASFDASFLDTMIVVVRGVRPGPTLCITAGIHGDEINGVATAHRVYAHIDGSELAGTLIVVPVVNAHGFRTGSRYLPDRRDLNRFFPGSPTGNTAALIAHELFGQLVRHCDALIDLHTGSFDRTNLPQIRTDLGHPRALELARAFGIGVVLDGKGPAGSLRRAAIEAGIPAVIYEAGQPLRFEEEEIARGYAGIRNVLVHLGMLAGSTAGIQPSRVIRRTVWVRARNRGGIYLTPRKPGDVVQRGDILGTVTDPITEETDRILAPVDGMIIGMAVPQVVLVGYALFHLAADAPAGTGADPVEERD